MKEPAFDPAAHVAHIERMMGLTIEEAWRPVVIAHVTAISKAADLVMSFDLPDDIEPAGVFRP